MALGNTEYTPGIDIIFLENLVDFRRVQLLVPPVGHALDQVPHFLFHGRGQGEAELLL